MASTPTIMRANAPAIKLCRVCRQHPRMPKNNNRVCRKCHREAIAAIREAQRRARAIGLSYVECQVPGCTTQDLQVDHDHGSGEPRFILCRRHNGAIACFRDDLKHMQLFGRIAKDLFGAPDQAWPPTFCEDGHSHHVTGCNACSRKADRASSRYLRDAQAKNMDMTLCCVCKTGGTLVIHHFRDDPDCKARAVIHSQENLGLGKLQDDPREVARVAEMLLNTLKQTEPVLRWGKNFVGKGKGTAALVNCTFCHHWYVKDAIRQHLRSTKHKLNIILDDLLYGLS